MIKKKRKLGVGNKLSAQESNWSFSGKTASNFDNHIKKSIPLYNLSHQMGLKVSDFFLPNGTKFYDLGCSTGSFINNLAKRHKNKQIKIYGIDEIKQMVEVAKNCLNKFVSYHKINYYNGIILLGVIMLIKSHLCPINDSNK